MTRFIVIGALSGLMFATWPLLQYMETGDPLRFLHVQGSWHPDQTLSSVLRAFWLGNPWQHVTIDSVGRLTAFWVMIAAGLMTARKNQFLGAYIVAFMTLEALSGEFVGTLRYAAVLFPAYFVLGDAASRRLPWYLKIAVLLILLQCNRYVTWSYGIGSWGY